MKFGIADPGDAFLVDPSTRCLRNSHPLLLAAGVPVLLDTRDDTCRTWRELGSFWHTQCKRFESFCEPVSGLQLSIVDHCVPLRVVSGRKFDHLMQGRTDMDRLSDREMQERRNNYGAFYDEGVSVKSGAGEDAEGRPI